MSATGANTRMKTSRNGALRTNTRTISLRLSRTLDTMHTRIDLHWRRSTRRQYSVAQIATTLCRLLPCRRRTPDQAHLRRCPHVSVQPLVKPVSFPLLLVPSVSFATLHFNYRHSNTPPSYLLVTVIPFLQNIALCHIRRGIRVQISFLLGFSLPSLIPFLAHDCAVIASSLHVLRMLQLTSTPFPLLCRCRTACATGPAQSPVCHTPR